MLRYLTQKLKSQSLNEIQPFPSDKLDDDHDSGTESDDENAELEEINQNQEDRGHLDTSSYGSLSPVHCSSSPVNFSSCSTALGKMHELSSQSLDNISCTSDYERQSLDFERHSSEEELSLIQKEVHITCSEKRKWSQIHKHSCDSGGSSDEEVKDCFRPQPLEFCSSPPPQVMNRLVSSPSPKLLLARITPVNVTPITISSVSPRKRHRQTSTSEALHDVDAATVISRPCLNFEKMQKTTVKKHCSIHQPGKAKVVKIKTINTSGSKSKCLLDPAVFSFRSISSAFSPLTPVEEPSCAI